MLWHKLQGAGGTGAASAVSSFSSPVNLADTSYFWSVARGTLTDNYLFLPEPTYNPDSYSVYSVSVTGGTVGVKTLVFSKSSGTGIERITTVYRVKPVTLTTGEEAAVGIINYVENSVNKQGVFVASPDVRDPYFAYIGPSSDTRNTLCSAGTWVAYYSHTDDTIYAFQLYDADDEVSRTNLKTKAGISTTNATGLTIDSSGTYAYLTYTNGSSYVTTAYNLSTGSVLGTYTWSGYPNIVDSYYDSGTLYLAMPNIAYALDVSTPASITLTSSVSYTYSNNVTLYNGRVYVPATKQASYEVFNIATSSSEGVVPTPADDGYGYYGAPTPADVRGTHVFVAGATGTYIFDTTDLNALSYQATVASTATIIATTVSADGNTLYQLEYTTSPTSFTLAKYNVSNKSSPSLLGRSVDLIANYGASNYSYASKPVLSGNYLYTSIKVGASIAQDRLVAFDVSGNTPSVVDTIDCPSTGLYGGNTLAYGDSVFVVGPTAIWDVNVANPASMSSAAYRTSTGSGAGGYTGLIEGNYYYLIRYYSFQFYFVVYDLSGHTPGSNFTTAGSIALANASSSYSVPVQWAIHKIGNEVFATMPNGQYPWAVRVNVANVSSPTKVLAGGVSEYLYSGYSSDHASCFLLHPDGETITSLSRYGRGAAAWNAATGAVTVPVVDVGTYGPNPISFFNSSQHVTASASNVITIGAL